MVQWRVTHQLAWTEDADEAMTSVEADPALASILEATRRVLGLLQLDPSDPKLRTRQYVTQELGHICSTPIPGGDWIVLWQMSAEPDELIVHAIIETTSL